MSTNIKKVKKFDKWLRKIGNIYYPDNEKMLEAYSRIEALKHNPAA
jgi:hypothetical protein